MADSVFVVESQVVADDLVALGFNARAMEGAFPQPVDLEPLCRGRQVAVMFDDGKKEAA